MSEFLKIVNFSIDLNTFKLQNISFSINRGDYLCIIGPTGAGKTILLESILGFYKPKYGKIFFKSKDITNLPPEKRNIGIIYQDYALFPHLSVEKNIEYGLKHKDFNKVKKIAEILGIQELLDRFPDSLSGGEKQRVAMARALIVEPELLLMDEPFSALDVQTKSKLRKLIRDIRDKLNLTVIHITHDLDDVWALANKVAIIKEGKLIQFGTLDEIMFKPASEFVAKFTGTNVLNGKVIKIENDLTVLKIDGFEIASVDRGRIGENVKIAIRPENIILFKEKPENLSARNVLAGKYEDYFIENKVCHVIINLGSTRIKALLTIAAFEEFNFKRGDLVYVVVKATNVRIV